MAMEFAHHVWGDGYRAAGAAAGAARQHTPAGAAAITAHPRCRCDHHRPQPDAAARHPPGQRHADHHPLPHAHPHHHFTTAGGMRRDPCGLGTHDRASWRKLDDVGRPLGHIRGGHYPRQLPAPGNAAAGVDHLPATSAAHAPALRPTGLLGAIYGAIG